MSETTAVQPYHRALIRMHDKIDGFLCARRTRNAPHTGASQLLAELRHDIITFMVEDTPEIERTPQEQQRFTDWINAN